MGFVHLHAHGMFSSDGFGTADDRAKFAASIGQEALGLCDHGTTSGLVAHYTACKKHGIKPILGCEAYFMPEFNKESKRYHMTILVMNMEGYRNLNRLISIASTNYFYRYPIVTWDVLQQYHDGLIIFSGCIAGLAPQLILQGKSEEAYEVLQQFKWLLGDRFYGEIMPFMDSDNQQGIVNSEIIRMCKELDIEVLLSSDAHYTSAEDRETHKLMFQLKGYEPEADYTNLYLATEAEVKGGWAITMQGTPYTDASPYIATTEEIAARCEVDLDFKEAIPTLKWDKPSRHKLAELCKEGLKAKGKYSGPENKKYRDRLAYEFGVIDKKGYVDYFLLCYDIYEFARKQGIAYGLGRGSVCGSVLAYAIGLTNVDPLIFGTHFERFLRPNKVTLPDVDMDFESNRRQEIIDYLLTKYEGRAAPISTFGYYKVKNLANDLGKALDLPASDLATLKETLEEMVSDEDAYHLDDKSGVYHYLLTNSTLKRLDRLYNRIIRHFSRLFGQVRYIGKHAAGVAITEGPIENYTALIHTKDGLQTAYDLNDLSKINVVKVDILGLITVDVIHEVEKQLGHGYDLYDILEDRETYRAFTNGNTEGVFQFESRLAKDVCKKVRPATMMELVACNALNRPGPIKMGLLDMYVEGKAGKANVSSLLYEHMQDSYGTLIYQEHVMNIARWAGLEWPEVDKLIKGISKKTAGKDPLRDKFIDGAVDRGMVEEEAATLYDSVSSYLFNKGHGVGYSLLSFYTMYLKLNHPLEYWLAMLKFEAKEEKRIAYELEAVGSGIGILTPHINGKADYSIEMDAEGDRWLRKGLSAIAGVGPKAATAIEDMGPYADKFELVAKVPKRVLNKTVFAALEGAGAIEMDREKQVEQSVAYCQRLKFYLREARAKEREKLKKPKKKAK